MKRSISVRHPNAAPQPAPPSPPGDWILAGLGVGAAAASVTFATYMMVFGPADYPTSGTPDFGIFVQWDRRTQSLAQRENLRPDSRTQKTARTADNDAREPDQGAARRIDFAPTGSIPAQPAVAPPGADALPPAAAADADQATPLAGFILRDVFDGNAVIESGSALSVVKPGSILDGAGKVLSIERRGSAWVVLTARGMIGAERR